MTDAERIAELESTRDRLEQKLWDASNEKQAAEAWLAAALEALRFYATAWVTHPGDSGPGGNDPQEPVCDPDEALLEDGGEQARQALAQPASVADPEAKGEAERQVAVDEIERASEAFWNYGLSISPKSAPDVPWEKAHKRFKTDVRQGMRAALAAACEAGEEKDGKS